MKACALLVLATTASAQGADKMAAMRMAWNPVVGAGASYVVESKDMGKMETEVALVGTETAGGKTGYWVEQFIRDPKYGEGRAKMLLVGDRRSLDIKRMLTQAPGGPLTEVPIGEGTERDARKDSQTDLKLLGTETVTTPAGTFVCQHYRTTEKRAKTEDADEGEGVAAADDAQDVWLSEKVPPFGIVKMVSKGTTQILTRVITNARPRMPGKP